MKDDASKTFLALILSRWKQKHKIEMESGYHLNLEEIYEIVIVIPILLMKDNRCKFQIWPFRLRYLLGLFILAASMAHRSSQARDQTCTTAVTTTES